ncbi:MAG: T9SS type A sorting domain-containing protein [Bacteroidia bacterium]
MDVQAQPGLMWAKQIGGHTSNFAYCMATDKDGSIYVAGSFQDTVDFDPGPNVYYLISMDGTDAFICKLDSSGKFVFAKQFGGTSAQEIHSIKLDLNKNIYTTGFNSGTADFDPDSSSVYNLTTAGTSDIFISKLDSSGKFIWAEDIGGPGTASAGTGYDEGKALEVSQEGNVYVTGYFSDTVDFDPSSAVFNLNAATGSDFICKFNSNGSLIWAKNTGGSSSAMALDQQENIYITGSFNGNTNFDPHSGNYYMNTGGYPGVFLLKLDSSGHLSRGVHIDGDGYCYPTAIALDLFGNIYLTGTFMDTIDFDPGAGVYNIISGMNRNGFVCKLDTSAGFIWARGIIGSGDCVGKSITTDKFSNVYTTGFFNSNDFDPGPATYNMTSNGWFDIYIHQLDASGNFICAGKIGGPGPYDNEIGTCILTDKKGSVYLAGYFQQTCDFDLGSGTYPLTASGQDIFVAKYSICGLTTGEDNPERRETLSIFPNPSNGKLYIKSTDKLYSVEIRSILGEAIYERSNLASNVELDLSSQAKGIYIIQVRNGSHSATYKWIKE